MKTQLELTQLFIAERIEKLSKNLTLKNRERLSELKMIQIIAGGKVNGFE